MRFSKAIFVVVLSGCAAYAQTSGTAGGAQKTNTAAGTTKGSAVAGSKKVAPAPAAKAVKSAPKPATAVSKTPFSKTKPASKAKPAAAPTAPAAPAVAPELAAAKKPGLRRDPFLSPIRPMPGPGNAAGACTTGKRCLTADRMKLKGVVKAQSGMIAVVENEAGKSYFLRENDPLLNGFVSKITGDSVVVKESSTDSLGKPSTRERVLKVTAPVV